MRLFSVFFFISFLSSAAFAEGFPDTLNGRDFFVTTSTLKPRLQTLDASPSSCRENIAKVICLVEPTRRGQKPEERSCLDGSKNYAVYLEQLYDQYPATLQKMFCSLRYIFIEKKFGGTAYAGQLTDKQGKSLGAVMGIRQSVLDQKLDLQTWASWKEELSFGGITDSYTLSPGLPLIRTSTNANLNDFLYFAITHEFGHLFDFGNSLNKFKNCSSIGGHENDECILEEGTWGALSWITDHKAKPEFEFPLRNSLCFYSCEGKSMNSTNVSDLYQGLAASSFISTYASTEPWDDFADSLAYYMMYNRLGTSYKIDTAHGTVYDIMEKLRSPIFATKYEYIERFLNRTDIVYP